MEMLNETVVTAGRMVPYYKQTPVLCFPHVIRLVSQCSQGCEEEGTALPSMVTGMGGLGNSQAFLRMQDWTHIRMTLNPSLHSSSQWESCSSSLDNVTLCLFLGIYLKCQGLEVSLLEPQGLLIAKVGVVCGCPKLSTAWQFYSLSESQIT